MVESSQNAGFWPSLYDPFARMSGRVAEWFAPRSEATRSADAYEITLELPGVKPEDVDVEAHEGTLTVRGEKHAEKTEQKADYFFSERQYGAFQRSFRLPPDADPDGVTAEFDDGVLRLRVAKRKETQKAAKKVKVSKAKKA